MQFNINIGRPRVSSKKTEGDSEEVLTGDPIFTKRNFTILAAGVAIGVILKQQSDIHTLKRTVELLQEVIR